MATYNVALLAGAAILATLPASVAVAEPASGTSCNEDAMIVFDASGSMSGNEKLGIATTVTRIDEVRSALGRVLPEAARVRRVGLITYGPGHYQQCNVRLNLEPMPDAAGAIMEEVNRLTPAGKTPLTAAVEQAADVLDVPQRPGVVVVLTDGEETCGRSACSLGKQFRESAPKLIVHVIAFRTGNFAWTGEQSILEAKCLAEQTNGLYLSVETQDELVGAFKTTLTCPAISERNTPSAGRRGG
jgi:Ca-activated chloride channel family protein